MKKKYLILRKAYIAMSLNIIFHKKDLPSTTLFKGDIAIDTEAMGLITHRDRLCLVQLSDGNGDVHLVQIEHGQKDAPNLTKLLQNDKIQKIFHYARFDVGILSYTFGIDIHNIYCTKIASRLCRTYTSNHGLKSLCKDLLNVELAKEAQTSDWGATTLNDIQKKYAAHDVIYLHKLRDILNPLLIRENRMDIAQACFDFLKTRATLDIMAGDEFDIFSYKTN